MRLRHDYLAITTFGIAVTLQLVALNAQALTGGPFGLQFIPKPLAGLHRQRSAWNAAYLAVAAGMLGAEPTSALERLVRSPWGRVLRAIREDETAAASLGKRAFRFRLQAFVIGCMLMGLGGRALRAFRRLHRARGFSADPDLPALDDADRRRLRQQPRRGARRFRRLGALDVVWSGVLRETRPGRAPGAGRHLCRWC